MKKRIMLALVSVNFLLISNTCFSYDWKGETRFGAVSAFEKLTLNKPKTENLTNDDGFYVDTEALVTADADKIYKVSLDYSKYKEFAPYVLDSAVVNDKKPPFALIWTSMQYVAEIDILGTKITQEIPAKYFLKVEAMKDVKIKGDLATRWVLANKPSDSSRQDSRTFSILDGSWYILPVEKGVCAKKGEAAGIKLESSACTYVRYFLKIQPNSSVPRQILEKVLGDSLEPSVHGLISQIVCVANKGISSCPKKQ